MPAISLLTTLILISIRLCLSSHYWLADPEKVRRPLDRSDCSGDHRLHLLHHTHLLEECSCEVCLDHNCDSMLDLHISDLVA